MTEPGKQQAYEKADVNIRLIVWFTAGLALTCLLILALMWLTFDWLEAREARRLEADQPATRLQAERPTRPPDPVLQGAPGSKYELADPVLEMEALRESEDRRLHGTGWVDRNAGVVHIPIDEAKQLLLEQGLPTRDAGGGSP